MNDSLGPITWIPFLALGTALLVSLQLIYGRRAVQADDLLKQMLTVAGWLAVLVGVVGLIFAFTGALSLTLLLVIPVVAVLTVSRYRAAHRRALLAALSTAASRGVPLERMVAGVAAHGAREMRSRASMLAYLLEAGVPLPEALQRSRHRLSVGETVALGLGYETGRVGESLQQLHEDDDRLSLSLRGILEKYLYIVFLFYALLGIMDFMMIKIIPVMKALFSDFAIELTTPMQTLVMVSDAFVGYWVLLTPLFLVLLASGVIGLLGYVGWLPADLPLVGRLALPLDGVHVMRGLAAGVRRGRPVGETIDRLARLYPRGRVRWRLRLVAGAVQEGQPWYEALAAVGLLRRTDVAVLRSAEGVGNVGWALDEMARRRLRRTIYRLQASYQILFPLLILSMGGLVLWVAVAFMSSLVRLTMDLA